MRVGFIGDVVGRPGRNIIKKHLQSLRKKYLIDFIIANTENASHGFGLTTKNANELFGYGIDMMSGGNHTWDKKEIITCFEKMPILRPYNYPKGAPGSGVGVLKKDGYQLGVINLMGIFSMPYCDNPFIKVQEAIEELKDCDGIFIDFHAEATSEKRALMELVKGRVSAIVGTHTHIGTDDLMVDSGTGYLTDIGLTGCRDNVIGMEKTAPLKRFLTSLPATFDVPNSCKAILQMVIFDFENLICKRAFKVRILDDKEYLQEAFYESN